VGAEWCKPNGQILLMEHGISANLAVAAIQKALNPLLYRIYGCHHTRNIVGLIQESVLKSLRWRATGLTWSILFAQDRGSNSP